MTTSLPKSVLILGSGGLKVGQAGEFDYSGSQAIKALKQEKIKTILVNPNIATVQTDADMADVLYLQPLNVKTLEVIIAKERPDAIFLGFGGQTALNLGMDLEAAGIFAQYQVQVLGTQLADIRATEDRDLFRDTLTKENIVSPKSISATTVEEALIAAEKICYPVMLRSGFSLGGLGSGRVETKEELRIKVSQVLSVVPQVLIEEFLTGWKEFEYEIVRDCKGNALTICNMENLDPMGIHTGESIVIAPAQTLNDQEHQKLRDIALKAAACFNIVGECNIQYAVNPSNGDYRVIEMNARLSRSSALASKATGYPLAFIAAKLALGKTLVELKNNVTQKTCAFFEPALDYVVIKIPRWDTHKLKAAERVIGTEMKSVGEVMAIGRTFPEALQKAISMLNIGATSLIDYPFVISNPIQEIEFATDRRLFALFAFFKANGSLDQAQKLSAIDPWFLQQLFDISQFAKKMTSEELTAELLRQAKAYGFSDESIAKIYKKSAHDIREMRKTHGIFPWVKQIDTLAGEFAAQTNYLYLTYHGQSHDLLPSDQAYLILGSGPYAIGSSVEFDWCAVNTVKTLRKHKQVAIMVNSNPETVSTDYDESDRLYFEALTFERVQDIADFECPQGICLSVGGQIANNLAMPLFNAGYPILGTSPLDIDQAENREKFSQLLNELKIDQPRWEKVSSTEQAAAFARSVGYPVLIRPSYVLSGAAMNVLYDEMNLKKYLAEASIVSPDYPVVISEFIEHAKELEIDAIADRGKIVLETIFEHIEYAGVHSGDATIILPPEKLYLKTIRRSKKIAKQLAAALNITGPFNLQLMAKNNDIKVIECNLRAARSFPFVSKVTGQNLIQTMTEVFLGIHKPKAFNTLELDYVAVKTPQFSYNRFKGADPVAHVEMASTGEVACIADDLLSAFYLSWQATGQTILRKKILLSIGDVYKEILLDYIKMLEKAGFHLYATEGTHDFLAKHGVGSRCLFKMHDQVEPSVQEIIKSGALDLVINLPNSKAHCVHDTDGFLMRRLATDHHIPLITNLKLAKLLLRAMSQLPKNPDIQSWQYYVRQHE
jgi:carbamoyl-phosphate synthase large subunit